MAATNKYLARSNKSARGRKRLRSAKPHNQALFANEGAGVARFWDAKDQTKCEVKPWPHQQMLVFALQRIGEGAIEVAAHAPSHRRRMNGNPADNGKKTMRKLLTILLVTGLAISPAVAQQTVCTSQCNGGQCTTVCTPSGPAITHRRDSFDTSQADNAYQQRAYEFELRQLERENNRR